MARPFAIKWFRIMLPVNMVGMLFTFVAAIVLDDPPFGKWYIYFAGCVLNCLLCEGRLDALGVPPTRALGSAMKRKGT
jgi:hypothetical protein